ALAHCGARRGLFPCGGFPRHHALPEFPLSHRLILRAAVRAAHGGFFRAEGKALSGRGVLPGTRGVQGCEGPCSDRVGGGHRRLSPGQSHDPRSDLPGMAEGGSFVPRAGGRVIAELCSGLPALSCLRIRGEKPREKTGGYGMTAQGTTSHGAIAAELLGRIRTRHPLIHHITNWAVMNDTANATLALGALPVMAHAREEVEEMVGAAGALVLNPGTLFPELVEAMVMAGKRANDLGVPVVYDPVGVGATRYRNETGARLLKDLHLDVIRGNSGEIGALAGAGGVVKGVESVEGVANPQAVARELALRHSTVVAITGTRDILSDGTRVRGVDNGHEMLKTITGTGCMATTVVAIFCAVESDKLTAAASALA